METQVFGQKIYPEPVNPRTDTVQSGTAAKLSARYLSVAIVTIVLSVSMGSTAYSQQALLDGTVAPMGQWLEYREARYVNAPILVHLRTGYERAIIMPEPVMLDDADQILPGCEIVIEDEFVAFYPTETFTRRSIIVVGQQTGTRYDLRVRASTQGLRQPMRLSR